MQAAVAAWLALTRQARTTLVGLTVAVGVVPFDGARVRARARRGLSFARTPGPINAGLCAGFTVTCRGSAGACLSREARAALVRDTVAVVVRTRRVAAVGDRGAHRARAGAPDTLLITGACTEPAVSQDLFRLNSERAAVRGLPAGQDAAQGAHRSGRLRRNHRLASVRRRPLAVERDLPLIEPTADCGQSQQRRNPVQSVLARKRAAAQTTLHVRSRHREDVRN